MALTDNLVAYYKLDGNSNDSVGSNNGTDSNISYSSAKINNGAVFSGSSSKISLGNVLGSTFTSSFTVCAWVKPSSLSSPFGILSKTANNIPKPIDIHIGTAGQINVVLGNGGNYGYFSTETNTVSINNEYFIVVTWNGQLNNSSVSVSVNNISKSFTQAASFFNVGNGTDNLMFGQRSDNSYVTNGWQDEIGIWSRVLTTDEISQLYNGGAGLTHPFTTFNPAIARRRLLVR